MDIRTKTCIIIRKNRLFLQGERVLHKRSEVDAVPSSGMANEEPAEGGADRQDRGRGDGAL